MQHGEGRETETVWEEYAFERRTRESELFDGILFHQDEEWKLQFIIRNIQSEFFTSSSLKKQIEKYEILENLANSLSSTGFNPNLVIFLQRREGKHLIRMITMLMRTQIDQWGLKSTNVYLHSRVSNIYRNPSYLHPQQINNRMNFVQKKRKWVLKRCPPSLGPRKRASPHWKPRFPPCPLGLADCCPIPPPSELRSLPSYPPVD